MQVENTTDPAPEATDTDDEATETAAFDENQARAKMRKANREAKALRDRLAQAEARLSEIDDAAKTDLEKAVARAEAAEKRAAQLESSVLRAEIAAEKGLTPSQAKRLVGSTREELEEDADDLLASFGSVKPRPKPARELKGGREPLDESAEDELDPMKLADKIGYR